MITKLNGGEGNSFHCQYIKDLISSRFKVINTRCKNRMAGSQGKYQGCVAHLAHVSVITDDPELSSGP